MQSNLFVLALATICFSLSLPVKAQSLPDASAPVSEREPAQVAAKSPQVLLSDIEQHELALYALFNELNSTDEFDVICRGEPVEATDSTVQFCEPVFLENIRQQVLLEFEQGSSASPGFFARIRNAFISKEARIEKLVRERAAASIKLMQQEMEELARANPQLADKLQTVGELQLAYLETVRSAESDRAYLMRQNDPTYGQAFSSGGRMAEPRPTLGAPPPGHTQPSIRFPADVSPRYRPSRR